MPIVKLPTWLNVADLTLDCCEEVDQVKGSDGCLHVWWRPSQGTLSHTKRVLTLSWTSQPVPFVPYILFHPSEFTQFDTSEPWVASSIYVLSSLLLRDSEWATGRDGLYRRRNPRRELIIPTHMDEDMNGEGKTQGRGVNLVETVALDSTVDIWFTEYYHKGCRT